MDNMDKLLRGLSLVLASFLIFYSIKTIGTGYHVSIVHGSSLLISGMFIPTLLKHYFEQ
jgi:hypothetical protein